MRELSKPKPAVMTNSGRWAIVIVAAFFDVSRFFFTMFWLFGPAIAAIACTLGVNSAIGTSVASVGGKVVAVGCTVAAGTLGFFGVGVTESVGLILSDVMGFIGFLALFMWVLTTNARLFKVSATSSLWLVGSFAFSEIPFIGSFPAFSIVLWKLYGHQIKVERAALKQWQIEQERLAKETQQRRLVAQMRLQAILAARAGEEQQEEEPALSDEAEEPQDEIEPPEGDLFAPTAVNDSFPQRERVRLAT